MSINNVPVIAIDGPSASGKGTVAQRVAEKLGFHYLDSGALYRLVALAAIRSGVDLADEKTLSNIANRLDVVFEVLKYGWRTKTLPMQFVRKPAVMRRPKLPRIRRSETRFWRGSANSARFPAWWPMAVTWVGGVSRSDSQNFPTASAETRAQRRYKQLMEKGIDANIATLLQDIRERDARDSNRSVAPLQQGAKAICWTQLRSNIGASGR